ncbi:MAG: SusC/RagA family TonB-linked outer membrane protein [Tannerellaceae bacterium]|nr:SusC/RagA family TonB-linked outer membrane protein [Tannerellaceae bacterium]
MEKFNLSGPVSILKLMWMAFFLFTINLGISAQNPQGGQTTITGVVVTETGEELLGAAVKVVETGAGTVTDLDGRFALDVPSNAMLEVSYLGYETKVVSVGNQTTLRIVLGENLEQLDEIVVVAYGTQRKKDLTGSVSIVDTKEMQKMINPSLGQALQGLASGVSVASSGEPGKSTDIRIRGVGSFADVGPLYVIDGMITDKGAQRELNTADIESIQILKDAASAALYGSRGANGVIIITTKRGKEGPTRVNLSANFGIQNIAKRYDVMDSDGFLKIMKMAYDNAGREYLGANPGANVPNTDWQKEFYKTGFTQDYNVDVSGGNQSGNYMFSFNYFDQDGTVKGPDFQRFTLRSNTEAKIGMFTVGENLTFGRSVTHPINGSPFLDLARMPPRTSCIRQQ